MKYSLSEITDIIKDRRTIYPEQYTERKVLHDQIRTIVTNATWAPTHGNTQPWRFQIFHSEESRQELSTILGEIYQKTTPEDKFNEMKFKKLTTRPIKSTVAIAIILHRDEKEKISEQDEMCAVACAVQNMYLTCTAFGLGGFWNTPGVARTEEFKAFLKIGEKDRCMGIFYIGYPAIEWPKAHRKPLEYVAEWR